MEANRKVPIASSRIPTVIYWSGILILLLYVFDILIISDTGVDTVTQGGFIVDLLLTLSYSIGISYMAMQLKNGGIPNERYARIGKWFIGGMVLFATIDFPQLLVWSPATLESFMGGTRRALALGGLCGLVFGIIEAGAIEREMVAEREAIRAEEAETQREQLSYLNALLRHEVLNTAQVINGYSTKLIEDSHVDEESIRDLETIQRRAEDMSEVIQDMQVLIKATQKANNRKAINLKEVVEGELNTLRDLNTDVDVNAPIPDDIYVKGDEVLHRVFANLFANAVEHNDKEIPRVDVTAAVNGDTVTVSVMDNGPGIPDHKRDTLFEPSDTMNGAHGLGLYLVHSLAERYDGKVSLSDTGDDGSTFTVELPRAENVSTSAVSSPAAMS